MDNSEDPEESIFTNARQITDAADRERYIQDACGPDAQLQKRVRRLLHVFAEEASFLELPVETTTTLDLAFGDAEVVGSIIGPYELVEQIGAGGMGLVFLAQQNSPVRRQVALKIIRPGLDTREMIRRFEAERQTLAQLNHPGITRLLDAGTTVTGRPWFVMELAQGLPITDFCRQNLLPISERLQLFEMVCDAVQHAHQNGVIHRDIKPANVLVTVVDGRPVPKVIDFGVARHSLPDMTCERNEPVPGAELPAILVGTPAYMSPEQTTLPERDLDARTDVYSLGILLYRLLTDANPFEGIRWQDAGYTQTRRVIQEVSPLPPSARTGSISKVRAAQSSLRTSAEVCDGSERQATLSDQQRLSSELKGDLDWITMKAIEKDRNQRYNSVADLAAEIRRYLNHQPVEAGPRTSLYLLQKFVRRSKFRIAVASLTLGVLVLLSVSLLIGWSLSHERSESQKQRQSAQEQQQLADKRDQVIRNYDYVNDLQAAYAAYVRGDLRGTEARLRNHASGPESTFKPGFEWHYLNRLCNDRPRTLQGDRGKVFDMEFSPDGRLLVSAIGDTAYGLHIWDVASGALVHSIRDFEDDVNSLCFSDDGTLLLTGDERCCLRVWEVGTWKEVARLENFKWPIAQIHLGADDRTVIAAQVDWHPRTSRTTVRDLHDPKVETTIEGQRLLDVDESRGLAVFAGDDGEISLRSLPRLDVVRVFPEKIPGTCCGCLSLDGDLLACGTLDGMTGIWWLAESDGHALPRHSPTPNRVRDVAFTSDSGSLISASSDEIVEVWDVSSRTLTRLSQSNHSEAWSVAVAPDGRQFAVGYRTGAVQLRNWEDFTAPRQVIIKSPTPFHAVTFSAETNRIAFIDQGQSVVSIHAAGDGKCLQTITATGDERLTGLAFGASEEFLWICSDRGSIRLVSASTGELKQQFNTYDRHFQYVDMAASGSCLAVGTPAFDDGISGVWDVDSQQEVFRLPSQLVASDGLRHRILMFRGDSTVLTSHERVMSRWNVETGQEILPRYHSKNWIMHVGEVPHTHIVVICLDDATVLLRDLETSQNVAVLPGDQQVRGRSAVSPDGRTLVTGAHLGEVRLWHIPTYQPLYDLVGLTGECLGVWFSADGQRLIAAARTASGGSEVMVWDASGP